MLQAQRDVCSLGLDPVMYRDQRVDFSLETPQGLRLVIEIDGGQHGSDAAQAHLDKQRDSELKRVGWAVWRIPTSALDHTPRVGQEGLALIDSLGSAHPPSARPPARTSRSWAATAP